MPAHRPDYIPRPGEQEAIHSEPEHRGDECIASRRVVVEQR